MFSARFLKQFKLPIRQLNTTSIRRKIPAGGEQPPKPVANEQPSKSAAATEQPTKATKSDTYSVLSNMHYVSNFDKRVLVWVKKYPSVDQIPRMVPWSTMQRANTIARIRICNIMAVIAIIGFIWAVVSGKREAAAGRHVISDRMLWYEEVKQKGIAEAEAKKKIEEEAAALAAAK
ncbi:UPF0389 protein GA21628 [Halictus rubicundus]|uniref:UPF0389 protein GA21628 n=1 Tax=Halictus rubicundus TaxID=77578 RepID=UPI0040360A65